jgi:hypothetical protein
MRLEMPIQKMVKAQNKVVLSFLESTSAVAAYSTEHQPSRTPTAFMALRNVIWLNKYRSG